MTEKIREYKCEKCKNIKNITIDNDKKIYHTILKMKRMWFYCPNCKKREWYKLQEEKTEK